MPCNSLFNCVTAAFEILVLSWTPYARLVTAASPSDYDAILSRTLRELKFHIESLLAILFFMATTMIEREGLLISWTLACLLYTLIIHITLDAVSGEALHAWLDEFPGGRHLLACMAKLPAFAVVATLIALALTSWASIYTLVICCVAASALVILLAVRLALHHVVARKAAAMGKWVRTVFGFGRRKQEMCATQSTAGATKGSVFGCTVVMLTCSSAQV